jgi:hypothetical protein
VGVMAARTCYPRVRQHLDADFAELSDQNIETLLRTRNMDAESMEGFFDDLGKIASSVGKAVVKAAPTVLPIAGGALGTLVGGPAGTMIGQKLGSLAGGAIGGATGQPSPAGGLGGLIGGLGGLVGGGSPAAGQLLQTLLRPQTLRAISSMALGPLGAKNISVGQTAVPVSAFTNLLSTLAGRAEAEYNASIASGQTNVPKYMQDYAGEAKGDPAVAEHRAEALYELLEAAESGAEGEAAETAEAVEAQEWEAEAEYEASEAEVYESEFEEA